MSVINWGHISVLFFRTSLPPCTSTSTPPFLSCEGTKEQTSSKPPRSFPEAMTSSCLCFLKEETLQFILPPAVRWQMPADDVISMRQKHFKGGGASAIPWGYAWAALRPYLRASCSSSNTPRGRSLTPRRLKRQGKPSSLPPLLRH